MREIKPNIKNKCYLGAWNIRTINHGHGHFLEESVSNSGAKKIRKVQYYDATNDCTEVDRIRIGWVKWKKVSGVKCDRKMPVESKDKVFKTVMRPGMTYGSECWAVKKKMRAN